MTDQRMTPEAELARLADGSLPAQREARLRAQVRESAEMAAALAEQERAVALLRALDEPAPAALRARVAGLTGAGTGAGGRRLPRLRRLVVAPALTAVLVAALVLVLGGSGGGSAPAVPQAAHLALASARLPAPPVDRAHPRRLTLASAGVPFPAWGRVLGARIDTVDGRTIKTVFYATPAGQRMGYAIASGRPLPGAAGTTQWHYGVRFTFGRVGSARVLTWQRSGHTCVIAARGVSDQVLLALATDSDSA